MSTICKVFVKPAIVIFAFILAVSPVFAEDYTVGVENIEYFPLYAKRDG